MQRNVSTVPIHHRHTPKFTRVSPRQCKKTSRLHGLTIGTPARQRLSKTRFPWVYRRKQQTATTSTGGSTSGASNWFITTVTQSPIDWGYVGLPLIHCGLLWDVVVWWPIVLGFLAFQVVTAGCQRAQLSCPLNQEPLPSII